jgi:hypothetical protein
MKTVLRNLGNVEYDQDGFNKIYTTNGRIWEIQINVV